jgi:hypothetical protein
LVETDLSAALVFSNNAYNLLPDSQVLEALVNDVKQRINADKNDQKQTQLVTLAAEIDAMVDADDFHQNADQLDQLVKRSDLLISAILI